MSTRFFVIRPSIGACTSQNSRSSRALSSAAWDAVTAAFAVSRRPTLLIRSISLPACCVASSSAIFASESAAWYAASSARTCASALFTAAWYVRLSMTKSRSPLLTAAPGLKFTCSRNPPTRARRSTEGKASVVAVYSRKRVTCFWMGWATVTTGGGAGANTLLRGLQSLVSRAAAIISFAARPEHARPALRCAAWDSKRSAMLSLLPSVRPLERAEVRAVLVVRGEDLARVGRRPHPVDRRRWRGLESRARLPTSGTMETAALSSAKGRLGHELRQRVEIRLGLPPSEGTNGVGGPRGGAVGLRRAGGGDQRKDDHECG